MIIIYDFDGTLSLNSVPKYPILKKAGCDKNELINEGMSLINEGLSLYEAYYSVYFKALKEKEILMNDDNILLGCKDIVFNKGVVDYFKCFATKENNITNYIVTSGIEDYVKNSILNEYMDGIYGVKLKKENNIYTGVDYLLDDNQKPIVIEKILKDNQSDKVVYIGDGLTDAQAFSYVKSIGGTSIFVGETDNDKEAYNKLKEKGIVDEYFNKDFSLDSPLVSYLKKLTNN